MEIYSPGVAWDLRLLNWWAHLVDTGDITKVFNAEMQSPSAFLAYFQRPTSLFTLTEEEQVKLAIWYTPALSGAMLNIWAAPKYRFGRYSPYVIDTMRQVLGIVPIVLFITRSRRVVHEAEKAGFTSAGQIPAVYFGESAYFGYFSREEFVKQHGSR